VKEAYRALTAGEELEKQERISSRVLLRSWRALDACEDLDPEQQRIVKPGVDKREAVKEAWRVLDAGEDLDPEQKMVAKPGKDKKEAFRALAAGEDLTLSKKDLEQKQYYCSLMLGIVLELQ